MRSILRAAHWRRDSKASRMSFRRLESHTLQQACRKFDALLAADTPLRHREPLELIEGVLWFSFAAYIRGCSPLAAHCPLQA